MEEENGLKLLVDLIDHMEPCDKIKDLAKMVLNQCEYTKDSKMFEFD